MSLIFEAFIGTCSVGQDKLEGRHDVLVSSSGHVFYPAINVVIGYNEFVKISHADETTNENLTSLSLQTPLRRLFSYGCPF
jgi:hypothetical protein